MTRVLLDINVVLDVFLARRPWLADSAAVVQADFDGKVKAHLSAASLPTIFYVVRKHSDLKKAHAVVQECLGSFEIVPVDRSTLERAMRLPGSDFEDNLQIAIAALAGLDAIVTRDFKGFAGSPVHVLTPGELLEELRSADQ